MFKYADNSKIEQGDAVLLENGKTPGTVERIITTKEDMHETGVDTPGIMLLSPAFGRVYIPAWSLHEEPLLFVAKQQRSAS